MKISNALSLLFAFMLFACMQKEKHEYPAIIRKYKKEKQYERAILDLYKINAGPNCQCTAFTFNDSLGRSRNDTMSVLSLNIRFDSLYFRADTAVYTFRFYAYKPDNFAMFIHDKLFFCSEYYGIEYIGDSDLPFKYLINESGYLYYKDVPNLDSLDVKFQYLLRRNKKVLSTWLLNYLNAEK